LSRDKTNAGVLTEVSLVLAAVFWGSNYAATKLAAMSMPPLSVVAFRFVVGGLLMYGVLRILEPESRLRRGELLPTIGLGCLGIAVGQTAFTFGLSLTTAANTGLIFATALCGACCWASRSGSRGPP
jgi:drug/metabolite transporter (DMT)-like permease